MPLESEFYEACARKQKKMPHRKVPTTVSTVHDIHIMCNSSNQGFGIQVTNMKILTENMGLTAQ